MLEARGSIFPQACSSLYSFGTSACTYQNLKIITIPTNARFCFLSKCQKRQIGYLILDLKQRQKTSVKIRWFKSLDASLFMPSSSESNSLEKNNRNRREEWKESTIQFLPGFLPAASLSPGPGLNSALWLQLVLQITCVIEIGAGERQQVSVCFTLSLLSVLLSVQVCF